MSLYKIEKLKKEFWDKYTLEFNKHSEAFELMRKIGVAQGEFSNSTNSEIEEQFKEKLEWVLDKQFPKHKCKERGNALVLYAQAVILFERCQKSTSDELDEESVLLNWMRKNYGESRCDDYIEGCASCTAWDLYDRLVQKKPLVNSTLCENKDDYWYFKCCKCSKETKELFKDCDTEPRTCKKCRVEALCEEEKKDG